MEFYAECTARTLFPLQVLEESEEIKQALLCIDLFPVPPIIRLDFRIESA